ncbi:MAG: SDR family NAD(P)-dependent oxidoreductase [Bacteroidales bacterium]
MDKPRKVLITGANGGIGRELIRAFACAGYEVIATDITASSLEFDEAITYFQADLSDAASVHDLFFFVSSQFGSLDVLINNAAISKFCKPLRELTVDEFDSVLQVNLRGAFVCMKEFIRLHEPGRPGAIINVSSTRSFMNESGWDAYGTSKGGVNSLTISSVVSLSGTGITVNAIAPGWIECGDYDSLSEEDHRQHPSGRVGKPDDISRLALFLADPNNNFINGEVIRIDGGMTKKMVYAE